MKLVIKIGIIILIQVCSSQVIFASIDSLNKVYKSVKKDTSSINNLLEDAKKLRKIGKYNDALTLLNSNRQWIPKVKSKKHIAAFQNSLGLTYDYMGNFDSGVFYYQKSRKLYKSIKDYRKEAVITLNIGVSYTYKGDNINALKYYLLALKKSEAIKFDEMINAAQLNIGGVYFNMGNLKKAYFYFMRRLNAEKDTLSKDLTACYYNLAQINFKWDRLDSSEYYFEKAIKTFELAEDILGVADSKAGIAAIRRRQNKYNESLKYYRESMTIMNQFDAIIAPQTYMNVALLYAHMNNKTMAMAYNDTAYHIIKKLNNREQLADLYHNRSGINEVFKNYKGAYEDILRYYNIRDSIYTDELENEVAEIRTKYEVDKKAQEIKVQEKIKREKQKATLEAKAEEQDKRNRTILISVLAISLLIVVFAIIMYRRFKITKKQNHIITLQKKEVEHQKELVDEKNQEILDSITYAKRLQDAILPSKETWENALPDSFILYKPKDIVAGDFYWLETVSPFGGSKGEDKTILFAAADCTGHGVPGAMVSVVCSNALNRTVKEMGIINPGKILDKTKDLVIETFKQSGTDVKDGMDISLCSFNPINLSLEWAGANNPLWILRNKQIIEIKPNKQPIGNYAQMELFTTHKFDLNKNDILYIFSDGYQDQFGGDKKKKFRANNLKNLFINISELNMNEQKNKLNSEFENWKGSLEQIDDVCIIGVRI